MGERVTLPVTLKWAVYEEGEHIKQKRKLGGKLKKMKHKRKEVGVRGKAVGKERKRKRKGRA